MNDQERLLRVSDDLGGQIQVSAADGATRGAAEQSEEARPDGAAAPGSCTSWCGWGN
jgi:hypothetical protein